MKDLGMRLGDERFWVQGGLGFMGSWARAGWEDEQEEGSEKEGEWEKTNRRRRLAVCQICIIFVQVSLSIVPASSSIGTQKVAST